MALPRPLTAGLLPSEIEYLATSSTHVHIVPLTSIDKARFLSGVYGPFRPPQRTLVPLWLALTLKKKGKCYIIPPNWMLKENLSSLLQIETTTLAFAEVPFHYVSIAKVILDVAPDDIDDPDEVRSLLKDLRDARQSKISQGLDMVNPYHLEMTNIAYAELCELRPFFGTAFQHLRAMRPPSAIAAAAGNQSAAADISSSPSFATPSFSGLGSGLGHNSSGAGARTHRDSSYLNDSLDDSSYDVIYGRGSVQRQGHGAGGADDSQAQGRSLSYSMDLDSQSQGADPAFRPAGGPSAQGGAGPAHGGQADDDDDDDDGMGVAQWGAAGPG